MMTIPCRNENLLYIQNKSCLESLLLMKKHPIHKKDPHNRRTSKRL